MVNLNKRTGPEARPLGKQKGAEAKNKKSGDQDCLDASEIMDRRVSAPGQARRKMRMNRLVVGLAAVLFFAGGGEVRGGGRPKGPEEDGTKPALTRIAGEGLMNSHAYEYLTELSDDIG